MFARIRKLQLPLILLFISIFFVHCPKKDDNPVTPPVQTESIIKTIGTNESGSITTPSGVQINVVKGAVPPNLDNSDAKVTFSIESPVEAPAPIPAGASVQGSIVRFGPDAFIFRWPVRVILPFAAGTNTENLKILHYSAAQSRWIIVPASFIDATKNLIGADVLELGYYTLATISFNGKAAGPQSEGGFEYGGEMGFYYSLTVRSVTFKFPAQAAWYNLVGQVAGSSGSDVNGPLRPTHARLPQGTYEIWITKTKPGTLSELPKQYTYTIPASGTIDGPLSYWGLGNETGWTQLSLPGGGEWKEGIPSDWPQPTKPMGTGEFQATLTWLNTGTQYADMDLHLYGPNGMHVYWLDDISADNSIQLDRDWQSEAGNAVENIFSLKQMPKGTYTVKVKNFGGNTMGFNLRVIRFGTVKTYSGSLSSDQDEVTYATFTVN
jgi:hypothetical protein